ncbi:MAG: hypothetical protein WBM63_00335 [Sedimenticolaceae bacterium]|jgi:hypothetical protein
MSASRPADFESSHMLNCRCGNSGWFGMCAKPGKGQLDGLFKLGLSIAFSVIVFAASAADLKQPAPLTKAEWDNVQAYVGSLGKISFFPGLLPVIMKNQDALELTTDQKSTFRSWRKQNYQHMVDLMNEIIERRIAFSRSALDQAVPDTELINKQKAIFQLQEELLVLRLSCRDLIMATFTPNQWSNFAFILEDYPEFAGVMP